MDCAVVWRASEWYQCCLGWLRERQSCFARFGSMKRLLLEPMYHSLSGSLRLHRLVESERHWVIGWKGYHPLCGVNYRLQHHSTSRLVFDRPLPCHSRTAQSRSLIADSHAVACTSPAASFPDSMLMPRALQWIKKVYRDVGWRAG